MRKFTREYLNFEKEYTRGSAASFHQAEHSVTREVYRRIVMNKREEAQRLWEEAGGQVYKNGSFIDTCCCKCRCCNHE